MALKFSRKYNEFRLVRRLLNLSASFAMKQPTFNPGIDQNWNWPEKTWFKERLNAVKAREQELRRKPMIVSRKPTTVADESSADKEPDKVKSSPKA